jgi:AAA+ superfamily predicted ATPase
MLVIQMISMFFMTLFEQLSAVLPTFFQDLKKKYVDRQIENTLQNITTNKETLADVSIGLTKKHQQNTVIIIRKWSGSSKDSSSKSNNDNINEGDESKEIADALLSHIASAENVPTLQLIQSSQFIINYKDKPVEILPHIYIKIDEFQMDSETLKMRHLVFRVTSNTYNTKHIRETLQNLRKQWIADQQNQLGDTLWYFEQKIHAARSASFQSGGYGDNERIRLEKVLNAPRVIQYEMRPFYSNKNFNNLYGKEARTVRDRIDFFMEHPEWYAEKGLPYQLGILLSGKPGSGKTAILRAIANRTKRHIINLKLSNLATATQLKNIFYNDYISVSTDDDDVTKKLLIPPDKRIYVFEEIDTIGELVQERSLRLDVNKSVLQDELTLGDILQILDGTIEVPGRILVMTSNYPERLDRALLRPGRIDIKVDFGFATAETISEVIKGMLNVHVPYDQLPEKKLTVAEILNIVFTFIHYVGDVGNDIVTRIHERVLELERDEAQLKQMKQRIKLQEERLQAQNRCNGTIVKPVDIESNETNRTTETSKSKETNEAKETSELKETNEANEANETSESKETNEAKETSELKETNEANEANETNETNNEIQPIKLKDPTKFGGKEWNGACNQYNDTTNELNNKMNREEKENEQNVKQFEFPRELCRDKFNISFHSNINGMNEINDMKGVNGMDVFNEIDRLNNTSNNLPDGIPSFWIQDTGIPSSF